MFSFIQYNICKLSLQKILLSFTSFARLKDNQTSLSLIYINLIYKVIRLLFCTVASTFAALLNSTSKKQTSSIVVKWVSARRYSKEEVIVWRGEGCSELGHDQIFQSKSVIALFWSNIAYISPLSVHSLFFPASQIWIIGAW